MVSVVRSLFGLLRLCSLRPLENHLRSRELVLLETRKGWTPVAPCWIKPSKCSGSLVSSSYIEFFVRDRVC